MEFSVISEKFQKFQINNRITIQTIRSLGIDIVEFSVISEKFQKFQMNNTNYPKPRYRYCGIFSNFREISEISNKQYKRSEA